MIEIHTDADGHETQVFDTLDELARLVAKQKADLRRWTLECCAEVGLTINGPADLAKLDAKLAGAYEMIDRNAAKAERDMRAFLGQRVALTVVH